MLGVSIKMMYILVLWPVLLASAVLTLTIDSILGTSIEDCFERIAIGEQIPPDAIYRNVSELTTKECEQICKQDKQCQTYDYGIGAKGNSTCDLSNVNEKQIKEDKILLRNLDYDVYVRRIQCEQSPPTPIDQEVLENGPLHRPVIRPDEDKRPLADEFYERPYEPDLEATRPYGRPRPSQIERPDGYDNPRPDDRPPSYGVHRPQESLYRPERPEHKPPSYGAHRPQEIPYRPRPDEYLRPDERPPVYGAHKPQEVPYIPERPDDRPPSYGAHKPQEIPYRPRPDDSHRKPRPQPLRPGYYPDDIYSPKPETPEYQYFVRPNRKPAYDNRPYTDSKPHPSHSYNSQYASSYGNSQDNSVHVEIYDPPNYKPYERPYHGYSQGSSGYGQSYGYQSHESSLSHGSSYQESISTVLKPSHSQNYGTSNNGHSDQNKYGQTSHGYGSTTFKPSYTSENSNNYGPSHTNHDGYGQHSASIYGNSQTSGSGYGSHSSGNSYGFEGFDNNQVHSTGYDNSLNSAGAYGSQGSGNAYGSSSSENSYSSQSQSSNSIYGTSQVGSYGNHNTHSQTNKPTSGYYDSNPSNSYNHNSQSHGQSYNKYDGNKPYNQPSYDQNSLFGSHLGYGTQHLYDMYGYRKPYEKPTNSYSQDKPYYDRPKPGYQETKPVSGYGNKPNGPTGYGYKPSTSYQETGYGTKPSSGYGETGYQSTRPSTVYGNQDNSYGSKPSGGYGESGYGNKPDSGYGDSGYQGSKPSGSGENGYGNKPSNGYISKPSSYGDNTSYQSSKPSNNYGQNGYQSTKPSIGNGETGYGNKPSNAYDDTGYQGSKPSSGYSETTYRPKPSNTYHETRPDGYINQTLSGYDPDRPDVKPVYEFEEQPDAPSYISRPNGNVITTRPVVITDSEKPGYGRNPDSRFSYKACFRRVLAGRRALRSNVRRVADCERLEDCMRECATERRFHCESFNYRLDPSFRGKGLCELMTKPIEAFDLNRDFVDDKGYDFYELDRNSLEPNCPETLRGPGLLHSGFLSSKPKGQDRIDWHDAGYSGVSRYDERRKYTQHKRYEDQFYVPYQIGVVKGDDRENWGQYGGHYGNYDSYYKNRNDFSNSYKHWHLSDFDSQYGIKYANKDFDYHTLGKHSNSDVDYHTYGNKHSSDSGYHTDEHHGHSDFDYHSGEKYGPPDFETYIGHKRIHSDFDHHSVKHSDFDHHNVKYSDFDHHIGKEYWDYGSWKKGRWNSSGSGWSRWDDDRDRTEEWEGRNEDTVKDCSSRRRPGMSLGSGAVRRSLYAKTVLECEAACFGEQEFKCVSYSYRYSSPRSSDNCFLSERPYKGLELSADSDSDVYAMPPHLGCRDVTTKPWVESECFWHVRSDAAVWGSAARSALTVSGLGACEAECIRAHTFFCRGFSFRFEPPNSSDDLGNCILTSTPPTSLTPGHGLRPAPPSPPGPHSPGPHSPGPHSTGHELYARGNYGRGCEPALYDDVQHRDTQCYLQYERAARLAGVAVRGRARAGDARGCGAACSAAPFRCLSFSFTSNAPPEADNCLLSEVRLFDLQRGVDYEHSTDDLLFAFDLFNGQCWRKVYRAHEFPTLEIPIPLIPTIEDHGLKPDTPSGPDYITGPSGPSYPSGPDSTPVIESGYRPVLEPAHGYIPDNGPNGPSGPSRPSGPSGPTGPTGSIGPTGSFEPYGPIGPIRPSAPNYEPYRPNFKPVPEPYRPIHKPVESGYKPSLLPSDFKPGYNPTGSKPGYLPSGFKPDYKPIEKPDYKPSRPTGGDEFTSWRHYTVSGFPCRRDTTCAQNHVAGHWACEPEGGEIGSWDYCCAPTHRCGYSEGFQKPWCYVGPEHQQWRPCSEKYYPYHQHNVPHPSLGHREAIRPRPSGPITDKSDPGVFTPASYLPEVDQKYWDGLYKNGPKAYYDKYGNPLPGYSRVPTESRPYIKYDRNPPRAGSGEWVQVPQYDDEPQAAGLGVPRYWPVAYLHKSPPPNTTYFRFNETSTTTERYKSQSTSKPEFRTIEAESRSIEENHRNEKRRNISQIDDSNFDYDVTSTTTTFKPESTTTDISTTTEQQTKLNITDTESTKADNIKFDDYDYVKGLDGKLSDFTSIEVFNLDDAKIADKLSDLKTLEAEEAQIEALGRILASKRGGKLVINPKKDLETKNIAIDKDFMEIGNRFPTRRGIIQRVSKEDLKRDVSNNGRDVLNDGSLEVSETTFVRPPRVLSTTENIRKAIVNGKVFYDATIRDQRDLVSNSTRKGKNLRSETTNIKNNVRRNVNPIRRVKRVYRKRYNPDEVRKRLLDREKSKNITADN